MRKFIGSLVIGRGLLDSIDVREEVWRNFKEKFNEPNFN